MTFTRLIRAIQSSQSGDATHQPPSKRAALVGGIVGMSVSLISHVFLLDFLIVTIAICVLYSIGVTFLIDYMRILGQAPGNKGSWWMIAFGATTGLILIVLQRIYRPIVPDEIDIRRGYDRPEGVALVPSELLLVSWLLVFGVALVSLVCGIGMSVTDLSEC
jgi:magnesium-transporting ATPase (P-type)